MASKKRKASRKKGGWAGFAAGVKEKPLKLGLEKRKAEKPIRF